TIATHRGDGFGGSLAPADKTKEYLLRSCVAAPTQSRRSALACWPVRLPEHCDDVEDQCGMQLLEDGVPIRAGELVDGVGRLLRFGRVCHRPGRQQRCGKIGDRSADGLGELPARSRILLLLDRPNSEEAPCNAIGLVDLQNALGELDPLLNLS